MCYVRVSFQSHSITITCVIGNVHKAVLESQYTNRPFGFIFGIGFGDKYDDAEKALRMLQYQVLQFWIVKPLMQSFEFLFSTRYDSEAVQMLAKAIGGISLCIVLIAVVRLEWAIRNLIRDLGALVKFFVIKGIITALLINDLVVEMMVYAQHIFLFHHP